MSNPIEIRKVSFDSCYDFMKFVTKVSKEHTGEEVSIRFALYPYRETNELVIKDKDIIRLQSGDNWLGGGYKGSERSLEQFKDQLSRCYQQVLESIFETKVSIANNKAHELENEMRELEDTLDGLGIDLTAI